MTFVSMSSATIPQIENIRAFMEGTSQRGEGSGSFMTGEL